MPVTLRDDRFQPGIHPDIPSAVYHERILGYVSKGALERMAKSPMHYRAWIDGEVTDEDTPAFRFGGGFHCALLEPDRYATDYAVEPDHGDLRTKIGKAARDEWRAANQAKILISEEDAYHVTRMVAAVREHRLASKMIADGQAELTALWQDQETGLRCRARADYYVPRLGMILDAKSTADASPEAFMRSVFNYRYHWQSALYREGFAAAGAHVEHFVFLAVEKRPPYAIGVYTLDSRGLALGHRATREHIERLAACLREDEWPGYSGSIETIETPHWAA